jgi:hypothetical protein
LDGHDLRKNSTLPLLLARWLTAFALSFWVAQRFTAAIKGV